MAHEETRDRIREYFRSNVRAASDRAPAPSSDAGHEFVIERATPVYVDFTNYFLVEAFRRMIARVRRRVVLEEVLPRGGDLFVDIDGKTHVSQLCFELSARDLPFESEELDGVVAARQRQHRSPQVRAS